MALHRDKQSGATLPRDGQSANLRRAWLAVALIPPAFFLAFAVGEGLYALLGYDPAQASEPWWVELVAGGPAIALFLVPCVGAVWFGDRARRERRRTALGPIVIGSLLGGWMLLINTVSVFVR